MCKLKSSASKLISAHTVAKSAVLTRSPIVLARLRYDKTFSQAIVQPLIDAGVNMLEVNQGLMTMSPMAKELERLVEEGTRFNHFGHPILRWNATVCVVDRDANGNIKPNKKKSVERIDGLIRTIIGLGVGVEMEFEGAGDDFYSAVV